MSGISVRMELAELLTDRAWRLHQGIRAALKGEPITVEQWWMVSYLARTEGATMSELVAVAHAPAPTVTRLVDKLVERALVYRGFDGLDRRRVVVRLSEDGGELVERLCPAVEDVVGAVLGDLEGWRAEALAESLRTS